MGQFIELTARDGHTFGAYIAEPAGSPRGGLVIGMEMYGVNDYLTGLCDGFAAEGYLSIAPGLFDRLEPGVTLGYDDAGSRRGKELSGLNDLARTMDDVAAAAEKVRKAGKVAIMGYCFGGTVAWLAACRETFDASIAYYGSNMCDFGEETPMCPVICHVGDLDTAVPPADVAAFKVSNPDVLWHIYPGVVHGFDNHTRAARHDAAASALARKRTLEFLHHEIG
jgi:carboxymethylenebutenolidase